MNTTPARKGLSVKDIQSLIEANQTGLFAHRHGLALSISRTGSATWTLRYTGPGGNRRLMTLEPALGMNTTSLKALEARAITLKRQIKAGLDPLASRKAEQVVKAERKNSTNNFEEAATRFIADQAPNWKNVKHRAQWSATLERYVYPILGKKPPHEITTQDILEILRQPYRDTILWDGARETASRVRMRIESVLNAEFAINRDNPTHRANWQNFRNPAQWKNHLEVIFKSSGRISKGHFEAIPFDNVPKFFSELICKEDFSSKALSLTILCCTRTNETLGATWDEFDLEQGIWTIPAIRMKAGNEHRIPLSALALKILGGLPKIEGNPYVFAGNKSARPLSNMAMLMLLRGMRPDDGFTVHGFRSTFRDWTSETTLHPDTIAEMVLSHTIKDKTVAAYRRGDAFERRKQLMQQWCDYLTLDKVSYSEKWQKFIA